MGLLQNPLSMNLGLIEDGVDVPEQKTRMNVRLTSLMLMQVDMSGYTTDRNRAMLYARDGALSTKLTCSYPPKTVAQ